MERPSRNSRILRDPYYGCTTIKDAAKRSWRQPPSRSFTYFMEIVGLTLLPGIICQQRETTESEQSCAGLWSHSSSPSRQAPTDLASFWRAKKKRLEKPKTSSLVQTLQKMLVESGHRTSYVIIDAVVESDDTKQKEPMELASKRRCKL